MDRQKKQLHHNMTGTEYREDMSGQAGLPRVAAEVPEECFAGWGVPLRSVECKL